MIGHMHAAEKKETHEKNSPLITVQKWFGKHINKATISEEVLGILMQSVYLRLIYLDAVQAEL